MPRIIPEPTIIKASDVSYDPTLSGLTSTNVQDAIDELTTLIISGASPILGTHRAIEDPATLQELADYLDDAQRPDFDTGNVATTIYVSSTGDDDIGNGTAGSPFGTLSRAIQVIPKNSLIQRTISLAPGSFVLPVFGKSYNNITILGASSTEETAAITSTNSSSQANGLILTAGSPGWTVDEHRGKLMQFTSGSMNGQYGLIYKNTSTTIYVSQDTRGSAFAIPAITNTFKIISLNTTINLPSDTIISDSSGLILRNIFFGGIGFLSFNTCDEVQIHRSIFESTHIDIHDSGNLNLKTSYIKSIGTTFEGRGLLSIINQAHLTIEAGSVLDGDNATAARAHLFGNTQSSISTCGEVVFRELGIKGLYLHGTQIETLLGQVGGDCTWRFSDCASGLIINDDEGAGLNHDLPELYGNITSDYIVIATNGAWVKIASGSSVTTTLATNAVSADGGLTNVSQFGDLTYISGGFPAAGGFLSSPDHRTLRHLIHFIDSGPADGFASGAYFTSFPTTAFPTVATWYTSNGGLKIVELIVTYNTNKTINTEQWKMYAIDGTTVVAMVTDVAVYSGIFLDNITRAIV